MASNGLCHQALCTQASAILAKIDSN